MTSDSVGTVTASDEISGAAVVFEQPPAHDVTVIMLVVSVVMVDPS